MHTQPHRIVAVLSTVVVGLLAGCAGTESTRPAPAAAPARVTPAVQAGAMRPVMREGQTEPRVNLASANERAGLFAVGAMAGLDGEITITGGEVWVSRVMDGHPATVGPAPAPDAFATLLVGFRVDRWTSVTLEEPLAAGALEAAIERAAREHGIDPDAPFPFRLEGAFSTLDMHVINGFCPHSGGEAATGNQPWKSSFPLPIRARVVGVYARDSQGVLTHHGTAVHAHALVDGSEGLVTGHIDAMGLARGTVLLLPVASR